MKVSQTAVSIALTVGLIVGVGGVAMAKGHGSGHGHGNGQDSGYGYGYGYGEGHRPSGQAATGTITCQVHGVAVLRADGSVLVHLNITPGHEKGCQSTSGARVRTGHVILRSTSTPSVPTSTSAGCLSLPSGALPSLSAGSVSWDPRPKMAPSTGLTLSSGSVSQASNHVQISYVAGSVSGGSFVGSASLNVTSRQSVTQLSHRCVSRAWVIAVTGTITL